MEAQRQRPRRQRDGISPSQGAIEAIAADLADTSIYTTANAPLEHPAR